MQAQPQEQLQHLEYAFQAFNQMSERLMHSYHQLETQVESLGAQLGDNKPAQLAETQRRLTRLERLLEVMPGGVVVLDGNGVVQLSNPAAIDFLGEPLLGMPWRTVIARAFAPSYDDGHDVSLRDGRRVNIATNSLGEEPGQMLLINNVTQTRQLQERVSRVQRLSSMGYMAASLAHQIRTPLSAAMLYTSQLPVVAGDKLRVKACADKAQSQLKYIESMISDMLVYTKGGQHSTEERFELEHLLDAVRSGLQGKLKEKNARLQIENTLPGARIQASKDALLSVLLNLAANALQASNDQASIEMSFASSDGQNLDIVVQDHGKGIAPEIRSRLFDPFVTTRPQGTGLGLAVVKSIVEKHGGSIDFETISGRGTSFRIQLPVLLQTTADQHKEESL